MASVNREVRGRIQGRTVVLDEDPGLPEGQTVTVRLSTPSQSDEEGRSALLALAGAWAEDAEELDRYLEWNRQQRKVERREIEE
ncbi:MAG: hypothetical protein JWN86_2979 [Planctomycetota bacterium]|nr:hypothetical protein [Planctomycetota bacterium]